MKKRSKEDSKELNLKMLGLAGNVFDAVLGIVLVIVLIFIIYKGALKCYDYGYRIFTEPAISATDGRDVELTIPVDFSAKELGELFESNGLSRDAKLLMLQYYCSEYKDNIKGGTYTVNTSMTAEEMFGVIAEVNIAKDEAAKKLQAEKEAEEAAAAAKEKEAAEGETNDQPVQEINMDEIDSLTEDDKR